MINTMDFNGVVMNISDFGVGASHAEVACYKLFTVDNGNGDIINFVVKPETYFVDHVMVKIGDQVTGFYDANTAAPLIYPPQYQAIVMAKQSRTQQVKVDYFNKDLASSDGTLELNLGPETKLVLENGQAYLRNPANHNLIVIYRATTKSIPAQTTPLKVIVMC